MQLNSYLIKSSCASVLYRDEGCFARGNAKEAQDRLGQGEARVAAELAPMGFAHLGLIPCFSRQDRLRGQPLTNSFRFSARPEPLLQMVHIHIKNWCDIERKHLREQEPAHDR